MTVIAYRDGVLASDSRLTAGDTIVSDSYKKITEIRLEGSSTPSFFAGAGLAHNVRKVLNSLQKVDINNLLDYKVDDQSTYEGLSCLLLTGTAFYEKLYFFYGGYWSLISEEYYARGCAMDLAYGAFAVGATAREAVGAAIKHNPFCGGNIQVGSFRNGINNV